jgi:diguanylate cyclase (GGDEF)-like protein
MSGSVISTLKRLRQAALPILTGPAVLAFLPALTLGAFWFWGETALVIVSLGLPLLFVATGIIGQWPVNTGLPRDSVTGLLLRDGFDATLEQVFADTKTGLRRSACFIVELDDLPEAEARYGQASTDLIVRRTGERILSAMRDGDTVARIGDGRFAICLAPVRQLDLELCLQMAGRVQGMVEDPISVDGLSVYVSCSIGFSQRSQIDASQAMGWLDASMQALTDAKLYGPSGIRSFSKEIHARTQTRNDLKDDAIKALENGQIQPWYQPQISTDTGKITGFEALARWIHPTHGVIPPGEFLAILERAGLMERLGQTITYHALTALKAWDAAGVDVPQVGLNFSSEELRNPGLVDRLKWELDRFDLTPNRISVEILETVMTDTPDDAILRNIRELGHLGCHIELDDFGTGHASIASIRRFSVSRIKIDRSFVMKSDRDPEQQRLIGAILTMAERLELETLAEGVETVGEHALLAQLGCDHVQGFGIGRPMPFDDTMNWIKAHNEKLVEARWVKRQTG